MKFLLLFTVLCIPCLVCSQELDIDILEHGVLWTEDGDSVMFYQTLGDKAQGEYQRSHYIHPLYTLDGQILTEDFPEDHPHHHGIFWAWHQLYIGDKRIGDGWENRDFKWKVLSVDEKKTPGKAKSILTKVVWKSPLWLDPRGNEKPFVSETTRITVYPEENKYRLLDIEISMLALEPGVRIGGSEDAKGYGGFSPRVKLPEDVGFSDINGQVTPKTTPVDGSGWLNISGSMGKGGNFAGLAILSNADNPGYPNPWILRSKRSMQNAVYPFPGASPVPLSDKEPTTLKYRLIIHSGLEATEIDRLHHQYLAE